MVLDVAAKSMLQKFQIFTKRVHTSLSNYVQILNENGRTFKQKFGTKVMSSPSTYLTKYLSNFDLDKYFASPRVRDGESATT